VESAGVIEAGFLSRAISKRSLLVADHAHQ